MEDMKLSNVDLRLDVNSKQGRINGIVTTKKICGALPMWNFVLVEGSISGNKASIVAFDFIGGKRNDFAKLTLSRDGVVMTVIPTEGMIDWFPRDARIGRHPAPNQEEEEKLLADFCKKERDALFSKQGREMTK